MSPWKSGFVASSVSVLFLLVIMAPFIWDLRFATFAFPFASRAADKAGDGSDETSVSGVVFAGTKGAR